MSAFDIPRFVDSVLIPDFLYLPFQGTIFYKGIFIPMQPLLFRSMLFMEHNGGNASFEDYTGSCWHKPPAQSTIRKVMSEISFFLLGLNIPFAMGQSGGSVRLR